MGEIRDGQTAASQRPAALIHSDFIGPMVGLKASATIRRGESFVELPACRAQTMPHGRAGPG